MTGRRSECRARSVSGPQGGRGKADQAACRLLPATCRRPRSARSSSPVRPFPPPLPRRLPADPPCPPADTPTVAAPHLPPSLAPPALADLLTFKGSPNGGVDVTDDVKYGVKLGRQNGVHVTVCLAPVPLPRPPSSSSSPSDPLPVPGLTTPPPARRRTAHSPLGRPRRPGRLVVLRPGRLGDVLRRPRRRLSARSGWPRLPPPHGPLVLPYLLSCPLPPISCTSCPRAWVGQPGRPGAGAGRLSRGVSRVSGAACCLRARGGAEGAHARGASAAGGKESGQGCKGARGARRARGRAAAASGPGVKVCLGGRDERGVELQREGEGGGLKAGKGAREGQRGARGPRGRKKSGRAGQGRVGSPQRCPWP